MVGAAAGSSGARCTAVNVLRLKKSGALWVSDSLVLRWLASVEFQQLVTGTKPFSNEAPL